MDVSLFDYLLSIIRHRRLIVINVAVAALLGAGVSLVLPKKWRAEAVISYPTETSPVPDISSVWSTLKTGGIFGFQEEVQADQFVEIMRSREILDRLVEKFDLRKVYRTKFTEEAAAALKKDTDLEVTDAGMVRIAVEARSPELAVAIVRAYIRELDDLNRTVRHSQAYFTRVFLEKRVQEVLESLRRAEVELKEYQVAHKSLALPASVLTTVSAEAELESELQNARVEAGILRELARSNHPRLKELRRKIRELERQIEAQPQIRMELGRLTREVKVQETVYSFLLEQLERARIQEARDTPTVQVIEPARMPEKKAKPRRTVITLVSAALGFVFALSLAFVLDFLVYVPDERLRLERSRLLRSAWKGESEWLE